MSSQPEEEEEEIEIEEGEIVSDVEEDMTEDEDDFFEEDEDEEGMDIVGLMSSLLATPDGDTVCSALVNLCYQMETQNKILIKMLSKIQPPK